MKVSIIVPFFNSEAFIEKAIQAIIKQTFTDKEVILVNNGSIDKSPEICGFFANKYEYIKFIDIKENIGAGAARNIGVKESSGEYIIFLDADDVYDPKMVEKLVIAADEKSADIVICGYEEHIESLENHENKKVFIEDSLFSNKKDAQTFFFEQFPESLVGFLCNKIYKSKIIKDNNILFPTTKRLEDGFFNIEYFKHINSCCVISDVLYHYRLSTQSDISRKYSPEYLKIMEDLSDTFLNAIESFEMENVSHDNLYKFYINEFTTCLEAYFLEKDTLTKKEWENAINKFIATDRYREAKKYKQTVGKYRRLVFDLYNKKLYLLVKFLIKTKTFAKNNLKSIFYKLKK